MFWDIRTKYVTKLLLWKLETLAFRSLFATKNKQTKLNRLFLPQLQGTQQVNPERWQLQKVLKLQIIPRPNNCWKKIICVWNSDLGKWFWELEHCLQYLTYLIIIFKFLYKLQLLPSFPQMLSYGFTEISLETLSGFLDWIAQILIISVSYFLIIYYNCIIYFSHFSSVILQITKNLILGGSKMSFTHKPVRGASGIVWDQDLCCLSCSCLPKFLLVTISAHSHFWRSSGMNLAENHSFEQ